MENASFAADFHVSIHVECFSDHRHPPLLFTFEVLHKYSSTHMLALNADATKLDVYGERTISDLFKQSPQTNRGQNRDLLYSWTHNDCDTKFSQIRTVQQLLQM